MLMFGAGASLPLLALAYGSRETLKTRRAALAKTGRIANPALGVLLLMLGAAMLLGIDRRIEAALVGVMPEWLLQLTTHF